MPAPKRGEFTLRGISYNFSPCCNYHCKCWPCFDIPPTFVPCRTSYNWVWRIWWLLHLCKQHAAEQKPDQTPLGCVCWSTRWFQALCVQDQPLNCHQGQMQDGKDMFHLMHVLCLSYIELGCVNVLIIQQSSLFSSFTWHGCLVNSNKQWRRPVVPRIYELLESLNIYSAQLVYIYCMNYWSRES
jgi:hypothetical protein